MSVFNKTKLIKSTTYTGGGETGSAPEIASSENATIEGSNSLVITKPSDTIEGNLLLAIIFYMDGSTLYNATVNTPSGWTALYSSYNESVDKNYNRFSATGNGRYIYLNVFWKVAGSSEPSSYTFSNSPITAAYSVMSGIIFRIAGADTSDPIDVYEAYQTYDIVATWPSITTSSDNCLVFAAAIAIDQTNMPGLDSVSDYLEIYNQENEYTLPSTPITPTFMKQVVSYDILETAGVISIRIDDFTSGDAEDYVTLHFAIQPGS